MNTRAIFFYDDTQGLGHLPRLKFLLKVVKKKYWNVLLVLWSDVSLDFLPRDIEIIKITYIKDINTIEKKKIIQDRINELNAILHEFQPNLFFIDYFPFWKFLQIDEITLINEYVHSQWGKVFSYMRDLYIWKKIIDAKKYKKLLTKIIWCTWPECVFFEENNAKYILKTLSRTQINRVYRVQFSISYYLKKKILDGIIIFWDRDVFDISDEFLFWKKEKEKFFFLWYLSNSQNKKIIQKKNTILLSTWWNLTSEKNFLNLLSLLAKKKEFQIKVLIGPYVLDSIKQQIFNYKKYNNISIIPFVKDFDYLLQESEFFFWYGWYWTFQSLFSYTWKAFIMPNFDGDNFVDRYYEQKHRCLIFEEILNIKFLEKITNDSIERCFFLKNSTWSIEASKKIKKVNENDVVKLFNTIIW